MKYLLYLCLFCMVFSILTNLFVVFFGLNILLFVFMWFVVKSLIKKRKIIKEIKIQKISCSKPYFKIILVSYLVISLALLIFCFLKFNDSISNSLKDASRFYGEGSADYSSEVWQEAKDRIYLIPSLWISGIELSILILLFVIEKYVMNFYDIVVYYKKQNGKSKQSIIENNGKEEKKLEINSFRNKLIIEKEKTIESIRKPATSKEITSNTGIKLYERNHQSNSKFDNFDTESLLHFLGYKVGKSGLSQKQRKKLLKKVIEDGRLSKQEVVDILKRNISMFGSRKNMKYAIEDWNEDLEYVVYEI